MDFTQSMLISFGLDRGDEEVEGDVVLYELHGYGGWSGAFSASHQHEDTRMAKISQSRGYTLDSLYTQS